MRHEKLAIALLVAAVLVVPAAHAKKKKAPAPVPAAIPTQPIVYPGSSSGSQAGGLPATNERVAALEAAVTGLRADLTAEAAARAAADARLANALNQETAARQAADAALASQLATVPQVFVGEGAVSNVKGSIVTVASKTIPAGTYFVLAAVQMVNGQATGDANARCVMRANDNLLADTSDLEFPLLTTEGSARALGSTIFAPLQGTISAQVPITIVVQCSESNGKNGGLDVFAQIAAIKAGTIQ